MEACIVYIHLPTFSYPLLAEVMQRIYLEIRDQKGDRVVLIMMVILVMIG
jgi:hypothetical protein